MSFAHPSLAQARKLAKELLRQAKAGEPAALARLVRRDRPPQLADAQLTIAREIGYSSWRALVDDIATGEPVATAEPSRTIPLEALLGLLHGARRSWTTVHATVREWWDPALRALASLQFSKGAPRAGAVGPASDAGLPDEVAWSAEVWVASPEHVRVQYSGVGAIPVRTDLRMVNGLLAPVRPDNPIRHLLDPWPIVGDLELTVVGHDRVAQRAVWVVAATPRESHPGHLALRVDLARGADRYLLSVDVDRGVLLRTEAQLDGEPFAVCEITSIVFDGPVADHLEAPEGEAEASLPAPIVGIHEAVRQAPFKVLVPTQVPKGSTLASVRVTPPMGSRPFTVLMTYGLTDGLHHLHLQESPETQLVRDTLAWAEEDAAGEKVWIWESPRAAGGDRRELRIIRSGTVVRIMSNLDRATLRNLAPSLAPVPEVTKPA